MFDLYGNLGVDQLIDPAVYTATQTTAEIDLAEFKSCVLLACLGDSADTLSGSVLIELEVEESDDNSTWTDVADADLHNSVTATNTGTFGLIDAPAEDTARFITGYIGSKRYIRVVASFTGTHTNGIPLAVCAVKGHPTIAPVQ